MKQLDVTLMDAKQALHNLRTDPQGKFAKDYLRYLRQFRPEYYEVADGLLVEKAINALCGKLN